MKTFDLVGGCTRTIFFRRDIQMPRFKVISIRRGPTAGSFFQGMAFLYLSGGFYESLPTVSTFPSMPSGLCHDLASATRRANDRLGA